MNYSGRQLKNLNPTPSSKHKFNREIVRELLPAATRERLNGQNLSTHTVSRLSGLLDRVRKGAKTSSKGKKHKIDKEHRVQVRWLHYNRNTETFDTVRQKNGGGNRCIAYIASAPPNLNDLKIKASNLFFPEGKSVFAGPVDNMVRSICDITQTSIFDFPNNGTLDDFLKEKGNVPVHYILFYEFPTKRYNR